LSESLLEVSVSGIIVGKRLKMRILSLHTINDFFYLSFSTIMGKGDQRSKHGKVCNGSHGKRRPKKKNIRIARAAKVLAASAV
jgi:ribosomal small subunit protein bTHX